MSSDGLSGFTCSTSLHKAEENATKEIAYIYRFSTALTWKKKTQNNKITK